MPNVIFVCPDSSVVALEGENGRVIMNLALEHGVTGIDGDCGGACSCATCHVHVDPDWFSLVGPPSDIEMEMLEFDGIVLRVVGR